MRRGIVRLCNASLLPEKFVFVGGKGGVGKTTMAAAISTQLASQPGRTLVVSTDPAHSLSDAFRMPLSSTPTKLADIGQGELWGMEIDSRESLRDLEKALDIERIRRIVDSNEATLGHGVINFLQNQGVEVKGFVDLLNMSPPGIDETVALSQLMRSSATGEYKRVVVDTAPTGHTLRLLAFPKFLLSSMQGLLSFQDKMFKGLDTWNINFMKKIVGDGLLQQLKNSEAYLDKSKASMDILQTILLDPTKTRFVVVSIPTMLAVDETERLLTTLHEQKYAVNAVIINQVPPDCTDVLASLGRLRDQVENKTNVDLAATLARRSQKFFVQSRREIDRLHTHIDANEYPCSIVEVAQLEDPPVGLDALTQLGKRLPA